MADRYGGRDLWSRREQEHHDQHRRRREERERKLREFRRVEHARRMRRRRIISIAVPCAVVLIIVLSVVRWWGSTDTSQDPGGNQGVMQGVNDSPQTAEGERVERVRVRYSINCTGEQPSHLTDPENYDELGESLMRSIFDRRNMWDEFENPDSFTYKVRERADGSGKDCPYMLVLNRAANTVTVMTLDSEKRYTKPYMAMVCSTGDVTPLGYFETPEKNPWQELVGDVYGQYATRIRERILFHSIPYYSQNKDDVEYEQYNLLGTAASLGCVRMQVCDVKWIYDNCPVGTPVVIYDDADNPGPMGKPGTIKTNVSDSDPGSATYRGFDPTDPDPENPWDDQYQEGTAIRTEDAQQDWNKAVKSRAWEDSITPSDLKGHSTDASSAGNPG